MPDTFVGSVGGKLADQFLVNLYTPAYLFWAGGAAIYTHANWTALKPDLTKLPENYIIVLAAAYLLLVTATAAIGQRFEPFIIRLLEGYNWPSSLNRRRTASWQERFKDDNARFQVLAALIDAGTATAAQEAEYVAVDMRLHRMPSVEDDLMPTALGNLLRSSERRVRAKYGLDPTICWSRLWTSMSQDLRGDISGSRATLDMGARSLLWGTLFVIWTIWAWWAALIALFTVIASYLWMVSAAAEYAELLEACFDTSRFALYKSLNLQAPSNSIEEPALGQLVTQYLWRGGVAATFTKST